MGTLPLRIRGIIFQPVFSDIDLNRLKFQHVILLFVKKEEKNPSHSIFMKIALQDNFLTSKIFHFNLLQKLMASFDNVQKLIKRYR